MGLMVFNTLTGQKEPFVAKQPGVATLYTCGPTVYDYAHIGNFRAYVFEDLLRRYLRYKGYRVIQVMNLTDIDDKTIAGALKNNVSLDTYTKPYIDAFFEDLTALNIEKAEHYPRATDHIPEMISIIQTLEKKGIAYTSDGSVYYRISAFPEYGKLSKKNIEMNVAGTRVDHDEYERDDVRDFVLWKKKKEGEPSWESPFGEGRPGWHIECSAMSMKYLGESFDIHTGGEDNIFPHHENEIAQSEGASGKEFVRYWMHCKFLLVNNEKMSKSKGNFYTLRDLMKKGYAPHVIRYVLLTHNYRHPLNFTLTGLEQAQAALQRIYDCVTTVSQYIPAQTTEDQGVRLADECAKSFEEALDDDLNIAQAMASVFAFVSEVNKAVSQQCLSGEGKQAVLQWITRCDSVLGIMKGSQTEVPHDIEALVEKRQEARRMKNYAEADAIRKQLDERGWIIEDTPQGPRAKKK